MKTEELINWIQNELVYFRNNPYKSTSYKLFFQSEEDVEGIKIRVSNHSANKQNDSNNKTISFITKYSSQKKSAYNRVISEYVIDEDGYTEDGKNIEKILDWELN